MRFGKDQAELVRRFALEKNVAVRTAQWHRKQQTGDWREFMAMRAGLAERFEKNITPSPSLEIPAPVDEPAALNRPVASREEEMELQAYCTWKATAGLVQHSLKSRDPNLAAFLKAEGEAQKRFREARRMREQAEMASGRLRPASDFAELKRSVLMPLRNVLLNMPREAGPRANPFDHPFAIDALDEWVRDRFTPQLEAAMKALENYESAAAAQDTPDESLAYEL